MAATGEVPAWLTMARDQEDLVIAWLNTDTWSESRAYLASTPRLLDADTDVALDELIGEDEAQIARHQHILEAARRDGIDEAYAVLAGVERFRQWIDTGFDRDYFAAHADERSWSGPPCSSPPGQPTTRAGSGHWERWPGSTGRPPTTHAWSVGGRWQWPPPSTATPTAR